MTRDRRDRDRMACDRCGRVVTVTRSGRLMAHKGPDGRGCQSAAWRARAVAYAVCPTCGEHDCQWCARPPCDVPADARDTAVDPAGPWGAP